MTVNSNGNDLSDQAEKLKEKVRLYEKRIADCKGKHGDYRSYLERVLADLRKEYKKLTGREIPPSEEKLAENLKSKIRLYEKLIVDCKDRGYRSYLERVLADLRKEYKKLTGKNCP